MNKNRIKWVLEFGTRIIIDIHKYLFMFGLNKKLFIGLLTSIGRTSNHTQCLLLSNEQCMIQANLIDERSQELHYTVRNYTIYLQLN